MATPVTVALDIGSSHSGYALCDDNGSLVESRFVQGGQELSRVPSCLLLQPVLSPHSFGLDAQMHFHQHEDDKGFHYFHGFPCLGPHTQGDGAPLMLRDHKGKEVPAENILSIFIGCLKDHVMSMLGPAFEVNDVTWVLTLPASCDDTVTDTLMDAAEQAGLPDHHLKQVSGMEAAAVLTSLPSLDLGLEQPLTLMLVDCGGGAVTASVFELSDDSTIMEKGDPLSRPGGGDWVDEDFKVFLTDLVGGHDLGDPESADVARAIRAFVEVKHSAVDSEKVALTLAPSLSARVKRGQGQVSLVKNKLLMTRDLYRSFFARAVDAVTATIQQALRDLEDDCEVDAILLFGGFGQCPVVKDAVKEKFPHLQLRVLPSPETVVARGAVAKYCQLLDVTSGAAAAGGEDGYDTDAKLLVVAIDFGTTYSGYCYSFLSDQQVNPLRVMGQHFVTEDGQQVDKVPTSVLFTPDKEFHSFGHEAEKTFAKIFDKDKDEAKKWFFFEKFKMTLLRQKARQLLRQMFDNHHSPTDWALKIP